MYDLFPIHPDTYKAVEKISLKAYASLSIPVNTAIRHICLIDLTFYNSVWSQFVIYKLAS